MLDALLGLPAVGIRLAALDSLEQSRFEPWVEALLQMDYNNPKHRPLLDMEGLKRWLPAQTEGYRTLFEAVDEQGLEL